MNAEEVKLLDAIRNRRSIRKFVDRDVADDILKDIIADAMHAPNAGNRRQQRIIVSKNKEINDRIGRIHHILEMKYRKHEPLTYTYEDIVNEKAVSGFYNAPVVVMLFGPKNFVFSDQDAAILIDHIYLTAYARGVAACMVGENCSEFDGVYGQYLMKKWNIPENYRPCGFILLGYYDGDYKNVPHISNHEYAEVIYER